MLNGTEYRYHVRMVQSELIVTIESEMERRPSEKQAHQGDTFPNRLMCGKTKSEQSLKSDKRNCCKQSSSVYNRYNSSERGIGGTTTVKAIKECQNGVHPNEIIAEWCGFTSAMSRVDCLINQTSSTVCQFNSLKYSVGIYPQFP